MQHEYELYQLNLIREKYNKSQLLKDLDIQIEEKKEKNRLEKMFNR